MDDVQEESARSHATPTVRIRASWRPYVVFTLLFAPLLMLWLVVCFGRSFWVAWQPLGIIGGGLALVWLWLGRFQIVLSDDILSYRTLFGGTRSIPLSEIERAEIEAGWSTYWDRFRPMVRLAIIPHASSENRPLDINVKVFCRQDIDRVLDFLGPKFHDPDEAST